MSLNIFEPEGAALQPESTFAAIDLGESNLMPGGLPGQVGVELRVGRIFIKDNRTPSIGPIPGRANFYLMCILVSDIENQASTPTMISSFTRIGDQEALPTNQTLFYHVATAEKPVFPQQLHLVVSVVKSKKGLRQAGTIMQLLQQDKEYLSLMATIKELVVKANPVSAVLKVAQDLAAVAGNYLGAVEDRPLATIRHSLTSLAGDFDEEGVRQIRVNTAYVNFMFELRVKR